MPKIHYKRSSEPTLRQPVCAVRRNVKWVFTTDLAEVTCRNCLYRMAYEIGCNPNRYQESLAMYEKARTI